MNTPGSEVNILATVRGQLLDAVENDSSPLYTTVSDLVGTMLQLVESLLPQPGGLIAKMAGGILRNRGKRKLDKDRIRRVVVQVWVRLLTPDQDYTMQISHVSRHCREIWGGDEYSVNFVYKVYDYVLENLQAGRFREYCASLGLTLYLNEKQQQVARSYLDYKEGGTLATARIALERSQEPERVHDVELTESRPRQPDTAITDAEQRSVEALVERTLAELIEELNHAQPADRDKIIQEIKYWREIRGSVAAPGPRK